MDETTKAMIKDMLNRGMDNDTIMGVTGATQEQIDQVSTEGKSSFLDNLGIFSTLQAAEVDPNQNPNLLDVPSTFGPTGRENVGAMDRETPFGDRLQPTRGGDIFSGRQFDQIRGGPKSGVFGVPGVQDLPVDFSELDDFEAQDAEAQQLIEQAQQEERRGALDVLRSFGKDVAGRAILSNILQGAGTVIGGPVVGAAAGITGLFKGGDMFEPSISQTAFNQLTPRGRAAVGDVYGSSGIMAGYNPISAFGRGPVGAIDARISNIQNRRAPQTDFSRKKIKDLFEARNKITGTSMDDNTYTGFGKTGMGRDTSVQMTGVNQFDENRGQGGPGDSSKIVCTMMNESYGFGDFRNKIWLKHSKDLAPEYQKGYHILFLPLVKMAKTNKIIRKVLEHIAVHRTIDIRQESRGKTHILGRLYRKVLEPICYWVGKYAKR